MELDPLILSRIQFAFVVCFHAIFPVFTIGLASTIAGFEALHFKTGNPVWQKLSKFWIQVFAVVFGIGVVSGIVMSFQFGTNWSNFSYATANFLGPVLSYEVITAFFLEAAFLGVLLFGRDKVPQGLDTWLGETGGKVSGGQARRICLCRILLRHPQFVLLDEPFNGLDIGMASRIWQNIWPWLAPKIVVLLTHEKPPFLHDDLLVNALCLDVIDKSFE